jgi:hypothetical protein
MVLPQIGGAAAVWTTAMLFFQSVLILGYVYAHLSSRHLSPRVQLVLHLGLLVLALVFLPLAVPQGWSYDPESPVVTQTLWLYALGVGLPFAVLSANAPLIQSWYGRTGAPGASDPYFLYAASNLGSFVALLGFPLVAEPLFGVSNISVGWSVGFVVLIPLLALAGLAAAKGGALSNEGGDTASDERVSAVKLAQWLFLAFLPSSLMLCVTTKISTDIGSFPLVWVVPLALYLLTFVLVFSARSPLTSDRLRLAFPIALAALIYFCTVRADSLAGFAALIGAFFLASLLAHRLLFEARPGRRHLTLFYVTMSVGGALGGLFNSIIAPVAFDWLTEFPMTVGLFLLLFVRPSGLRRPAISAAVAFVLCCLSLAILVGWIPGTGGLEIDERLLVALAVLIGAAVALRRDGIAPALLGISLLLPAFVIGNHNAILRDRSFFGVHVVRSDETLRTYANGTTVHGGQRLADYDRARPRPISYYHPDGSIAQVLSQRQESGATSIGIVGLGIGALACYARPGEDWHFYEIDQKVVDIALDPALFTYMTSCAPDSQIHLGDARIVLEQQSNLEFDVLVIDAYSSDAVPVHLTTVEAMELYLARMTPDGILVFHISNRFYDLSQPLARAARELGLHTRYRTRTTAELTDAPYDVSSMVMILARTPEDLGPFAADPDWRVPVDTAFPLWTDDHANLLSALK